MKDPRVLKIIRDMSKDNSMTLIHGAGTQISDALKSKKIHYEFIDGIRHTTTEGLRICLKESNKTRKSLENRLKGTGVSIISPVCKKGKNIINRNAEEIFGDIHKDFDKKIIFTISDREKPLLKNINDVEVIKLEPLHENILRL